MRDCCNEIRLLFDDRLDDVLDASSKERFEDHLLECTSCCEAFDRLRELSDDLATLGDVADRIAEPGAVSPPVARRWFMNPGRWRRGVAAAAIVVIGLSLTLSEMRRYEMTPAPVPTNPPSSGFAEKTPTGEPSFSIATPKDKLAVQCESSNPRIHIVWLYDEVRPADDSSDRLTDPDNHPPA